MHIKSKWIFQSTLALLRCYLYRILIIRFHSILQTPNIAISHYKIGEHVHELVNYHHIDKFFRSSGNCEKS